MRKPIAARFHDITSFLNAVLWVALSAITLGSILFNSVDLAPSLAMGLLFFLTGAFFYKRANYLHSVILLQQKRGKLNKFLLKYLYLDSAFVLLSLLLAVVLNTAAASRVFGDRLSIFG